MNLTYPYILAIKSDVICRMMRIHWQLLRRTDEILTPQGIVQSKWMDMDSAIFQAKGTTDITAYLGLSA